MACAIVSFQSDKKKTILIFQALTGLFFCIHFGMLAWFDNRNTITGMTLNVISMSRGFVFNFRHKKWGNFFLWPWFFSLLTILIAIFTWDGLLSLLPTASMVLSCFALWVNHTPLVRKLTLPSSLLWMIYNAYNHSFAGVSTEIFVTTSILLAIYRFEIRKKKPK